MKKKYIFPIVLAAVVIVAAFVTKQPSAYADCAGISTSVINCNDGGDPSKSIGEILRMIFTILTYGAGALGVMGVIIVGIMYMTARDSTEQVAKAKKRMLEIAVGLVLFAGFGTIMNWLVPGGVTISNSSSNSSQTSNAGSSNGGAGNGSSTGGSSTPPGDNSGSNNSSGDRQSGSESTTGMTGSVGNGSEGWIEQSLN